MVRERIRTLDICLAAEEKKKREEREERRTRSTRGGKQTLVQKEQNVNIVDDGKDDDEGCGTSENIIGIDK